MIEKLKRLSEAGFEAVPMPGLRRHAAFTRDGFAALVERSGDDLGAAGTAGLVTGQGFAVLVWRNGQGYFVTRGFEQPASPEQVERLRAFTRDLEAALRG